VNLGIIQGIPGDGRVDAPAPGGPRRQHLPPIQRAEAVGSLNGPLSPVSAYSGAAGVERAAQVADPAQR
jgi:hypothetical protein